MLEEIKGLVWTLAGTALVLITLSGSTKMLGLWISGIALSVNIVMMMFPNKEDQILEA